MPLVDLICPCGNRYEAIKSFSTLDPDLEKCPACGGVPSRAPSAGRFVRERGADEFGALELEEHLEAKAFYESEAVAAKVLSGEIGLRERGPKWLRPVCPESLRRRFF